MNRVDEIIIFHSLSKEQLVEIVEIQIRRLAERLREQKIELELTEAAKRHLAEVGYDPVYGARPLKRAIQNELADPLAKEILEGRFGEGDMVEVDIEGDRLVFQKKEVGEKVAA